MTVRCSHDGFAVTTRIALVALAVCCSVALALLPGQARAAVTIKSFAASPSTTQAGAHPNVTYALDLDVRSLDDSGDDLRTVLLDLPAGALMNAEAVPSKCGAAAFASDTCAVETAVGTAEIKLAKGGSPISATGAVYVLEPGATEPVALGLILRPTGYQPIMLRAAVAGIIGNRSALELDYGASATLGEIPRTITTTAGQVVGVTLSSLRLTLNSRSGAGQAGAYFSFNPTRCALKLPRGKVTSVATTRAALTTYDSATAETTSSFTPTGCDAVPLTPSGSAKMTKLGSEVPTGLSFEILVPTADATIQQSHIRNAVIRMPDNSGLNFSAIGSVPAVCTQTQLNADSCPIGSRVGSASADSPLLPPAMRGDLYLISRTSSIGLGFVLRGARGTKVVVTAAIAAVDSDDDGMSDYTQFRATNLPQAPFSVITLNMTAPLLVTPASCDTQSFATAINGYNGAAANWTETYVPICDDALPPDTVINGWPLTLSGDTTPTVLFYATESGTTFECRVDSGAWLACTSPFTAGPLADGAHTIAVRAIDLAGNVDPTPASTSFTVDTVPPPPAVIDSPTEGQTLTTRDVTVSFTLEAGGQAGCAIDGTIVANGCTSPYTFTGLSDGAHVIEIYQWDAAGNGPSSATVRFTLMSEEWLATLSLTPSVTTAAANADWDLVIDASGSGDLKSAAIKLFGGPHFSLAAPPACAASDAVAGTCPVDSKVGDVELATSNSFGAATLQLAGSVFRTAPPTSLDAGGLAVEVASPSGRIFMAAGIQAPDNPGAQTISFREIPRTTSTGTSFHLTRLRLALDGAAGGPAHPFLTNQSVCDASAVSPGTITYTSYAGATLSGSTDYPASTGCADVPFAPAPLKQLSNLTVGGVTDVRTSIDLPPGSLTVKRAQFIEPLWLEPNWPAFGAELDQCPDNGATFDPAACPPQAKIGTMSITTPLLGTPFAGNAYLIYQPPFYDPWLDQMRNAVPLLGVELAAPGINKRFVIQSNWVCTAETAAMDPCDQQVGTVVNLNDFPVTNITLDLGTADRFGANGAVLSGKPFKVLATCGMSLFRFNTTSHSGKTVSSTFACP